MAASTASVPEFEKNVLAGPFTGAILESSSGDVYVKMTGPKEVVKGAAPALEKMVRGAAAR